MNIRPTAWAAAQISKLLHRWLPKCGAPEFSWASIAPLALPIGNRHCRRPEIGVAARAQRGAVLLEVLLALALFVAAAAIVTASMNASLEGLDRLKLNTHAGNLAVTVFSELQLGSRAAEASGAQAFEPPFQDWSWELALTPAPTETGESGGLTQVEVIIRRKDPDVVYRQAQLLNLEKSKPTTAGAAATSRF